MNTLALLAVGVAVVFAAPKSAIPGVPASVNDADYVAAVYGYEAPSPLFKNAPLLQSKRHISPSYDVEIDAGNMRNLLDVGKRSAPMAADYGNQFQMYNRLIDAGKKKRSSMISPSYQFEDALGLSDALERAGRR
ncbi:hypothetical protein GCK72_003633 [Caenorhabditis remanei]|nr:hypothetical protein GCK72_003633 [Caenorhabditis remanei]KAF1763688.1 hypothetical protein GCK72_003633 [Caenorhabditis remanei]